jgi:hypothetical protein
MPQRELPRALYSSLLDAFRELPGNIDNASRKAGCDWRTAKHAWEKGWAENRGHGARFAPWAVPIKGVIESEQAEARVQLARARAAQEDARMRRKAPPQEPPPDNLATTAPAVQAAMAHVEAETDLERVRKEAVERKAEWARAAARSRRNALAVLQVQGEIMSSILMRADEWRGDLRAMKLDAKTVLSMVRQIGLSVRITTEALQGAQQVENLAVGSPTDILGLLPMTGDAMSLDEAEVILERSHSVMQRLKAKRGAIDMVGDPSDGG